MNDEAERSSARARRIAELQESYFPKQEAIRARLNEFAALQQTDNDLLLFEELVYCICTAGASAKMGLKSIKRLRKHLKGGIRRTLTRELGGAHRFPRARANYIADTRNFLKRDCGFRLREKLESFGADMDARRDYFAANPGVRGIGYKEASHFLRNVGYRGYAILDKHILKALCDCGVIVSPKPPATKKKYLAYEASMKEFAAAIGIDFDELDLLLWSNKTGEILK